MDRQIEPDAFWAHSGGLSLLTASFFLAAANFPVDSLCGSFREIFDGFREIVSDLAPEAQQRLFYGTAKQTYATVSRDMKAAA